MLRHIVIFKIKEEYKNEIPAIIDGFYAMKGKIEGLIDLEAGSNTVDSERAGDVALLCTFADRKAHDYYQAHPLHAKVKETMARVREWSKACDYEIDA